MYISCSVETVTNNKLHLEPQHNYRLITAKNKIIKIFIKWTGLRSYSLVLDLLFKISVQYSLVTLFSDYRFYMPEETNYKGISMFYMRQDL